MLSVMLRLGEAVDAGIIKTPIIGRTRELIEQAHDDASYRYEAHLRLAMSAGCEAAMNGRRAVRAPCYSSCARTPTPLIKLQIG